MKKPLFIGLCTALVTPFVGEKINYPMLEVLLRRQIDAGVRAVAVAGTTGESPTLTMDEKLELFRRSAEIAHGECVILAGTGGNNTKAAVELSQLAAQTGVDGLLVVTPYYNKSTPTGLVRHYAAISEAAEIPVIAYNVPGRTGVDLSPAVCRELAKLPGIVGLKEAGGDISKVLKIVTECGGALPLYSGNDDQTVPIMSLGGMGVISVASNICPKAMNTMVTAAWEGNYDLAALWQKRLLPLTELLFRTVNPIPVKAALKEIGFDPGGCRMPLDSLDPGQQAELQDFFRCWKEIS